MLRVTSRRVTARLARHISRGPDVVRYASIHAFFIRCAVATSSALPDRARLHTSQALHGAEPLRNFARAFHASARCREERVRKDDKVHGSAPSSSAPKDPASAPEPDPLAHLESYPPFIRRLAVNLPHLHRPSRDELLEVANGFWERTRIRFRWLTIRSFRQYNTDDISAFVSLLVLSQTVWILVGTTTFFSVVFATANSLSLQEYIAQALSDYLTSETGVVVVFESAIVPKWKDSRISIKNVYISRRPGNKRASAMSKHDPHRASAVYDIHNHPSSHVYGEEPEDTSADEPDENAGYSQFDLSVDSIDVTLSLWRWLDGKGLVQDAVMKGVRGVLDRSHITWDPNTHLDPAAYRRKPHPGDFNFESFTIEDLLITVHQPYGFRPFPVSIFRADLKSLRKQWMAFDFLNAENIVGQFDGCLFSLHRPQSMGRTNECDLRDSPWSRISRFRIDGVSIDHVQAQTTHDGPIAWITSGRVDAVLDLKFPRDTSPGALDTLLGELADAITPAALTDLIPGQRELAKPPLIAPAGILDSSAADAEEPKIIVDIDLRFKDLKAAVPVFTQNLTYVSNALIRPIVAFMNTHRTLVPIRCRALRTMSDFDGSWTLWETGLINEVALKVYEAMAYHVMQANMRRRIRTVSYWSLQQTMAALVAALRVLADPVREQLRDVYGRLDDAVSFEAFLAEPASTGDAEV